MSVFRSFFVLNQPIIVFTYGLAFFVMGLAIALQSRRSSRLELARSLAWLAAFGILHSLFLWGELFSPVQEAYLNPRGIVILHRAHLLFLSASFICLLEFGVALLRPLGRGGWIHSLTLLLMAVYGLLLLVVLPRVFPEPHAWHDSANALARYMIGFPGALLAAYGLREQTFRHIAPLEAPHIVSMLRTAGIALALYALFGGLLPPTVPFFPGNLINEDTFERYLGLPPLVFLSLIGLVLAVTIIRALEIFDVETERRIEAMEQQQILSAERERIGRELHDRTIQTAYTASLLVDSARKLADPHSRVAARLDKAVLVLDEVITDLRSSLGELQSSSSGLALPAALQQVADDPRFRSLVDISLDLGLPESESLSPNRTDQVLAVVGEALANVVRHAHARRVWLGAQRIDGRLQVTVRDDGSGFSDMEQAGYGLRNMQERARLLGGRLEINSEKGKGTTVVLDVPWEDVR